MTGLALSNDFPTTSKAIQTTNNQFSKGGYNVFVTKLCADGTLPDPPSKCPDGSEAYSTYLGGSGDPSCFPVGYGDYGNAIAVDSAGDAYIAGTTNSLDFPTQSAYQKDFGCSGDAFLTKLSSDGQSLMYSTFVGVGAALWRCGE